VALDPVHGGEHKGSGVELTRLALRPSSADYGLPSPRRVGSVEHLRAIIGGLSARTNARISVGEIVSGFEAVGSLGAVLFMLTAPVLLPLPPGPSMVISLPLLIVAPQLILGRRRLSLPTWLSELTVSQKIVTKVCGWALPVLRKLEDVGRPRLLFLTGSIGVRLLGVVATLIAVVEVLPIPFGTILPAVALLCLSFGLTVRDGLLVLAGYLVTIISGVVMMVGTSGLTVLAMMLLKMKF